MLVSALNKNISRNAIIKAIGAIIGKTVLLAFFYAFSLYINITKADELDDFLSDGQLKDTGGYSVKSASESSYDSSKDFITTNEIQTGVPAKRIAPKPKTNTAIKEPPYQKNLVSSFKNWVILSANPKGNPMYYAVIYAKRRIGNIDRKDSNAYFMVHYFTYYKQRVSFFFDYKINAGSRVFISIDGRKFELIPYENYAFADDEETDAAIISALLNAKRLLIRAEGEGNVYSVDEYDVRGFPKVYSEMKERYVKKNHSAPNANTSNAGSSN